MRSSVWAWAGVAGLSASAAQGAGFEKSVPWSGRYGGLAGATTAIVDGSTSLAFNPAGLARAPAGQEGVGPLDVSLNFSPTFSRFRGPIASTEQLESITGFAPIFGGTVAWRPRDWLGIGLGGFYSGGVNALYEGVSLATINPQFDTLAPDFKSYLRVVELSAGVAAELVEGLRIGAAWRIAMVGADLNTAAVVPAPAGSPAGTPPVAAVGVRLTDLSDTSFSGFRIGAQYEAPERLWTLGLHWRTPITFEADGTAAGTLESGLAAGPSAPVPGGAATVKAEFPSQIVAGASFAPVPRWLRLIGEYMFTHYAVTKELVISGSLQGPTGPIPLSNLPLDWDDQHTARVAVEVGPADAAQVRAGYAFTSQVTPPERARATLAVPGVAHTLTIGGGGVIARWLRLDGAFETSWGDGEGTSEFGFPGKFEEVAWVAHLSAGAVF